jgi:hypothetical protein
MASPLGGLPRPPITEGRDPYQFFPPWAGWFTLVQTIVQALSSSGTTAQRPTATLWIGRMYFDTTLGKPIWIRSLSPTVWIDASGAVV